VLYSITINNTQTKEIKMASIVLDVVVEGDVLEYATDMAALYDLKVNVLQEHGPAGGWPVIKFEGHRKRIEAYLRVYADHDRREYEDLFAQISE
jgi:hypothetical protein